MTFFWIVNFYFWVFWWKCQQEPLLQMLPCLFCMCFQANTNLTPFWTVAIWKPIVCIPIQQFNGFYCKELRNPGHHILWALSTNMLELFWKGKQWVCWYKLIHQLLYFQTSISYGSQIFQKSNSVVCQEKEREIKSQ